MSGIYIPDMKIPGSCLDCLKIGWHYVFECYLDDAEEGKRLASCPLVPVPDHKGPLVDALEVINTFPEEFIFTNEQARAFTNYIIPADKEGEG